MVGALNSQATRVLLGSNFQIAADDNITAPFKLWTRIVFCMLVLYVTWEAGSLQGVAVNMRTRLL